MHKAAVTELSLPGFKLKQPVDVTEASNPFHTYGRAHVCATDARGQATPGGRSPDKIVVDATEGFVPLWAKGSVLRWRFKRASLAQFQQPELVAEYIRIIFNKALVAWGTASPVRFTEVKDAHDFQIEIKASNDCNMFGCTLASAFFPDAGRHTLTLYPEMFEQPEHEQIETLIHEVGHIFGLRHFFAKVQEQEWPAEIFGTHKKFSIMNYGADSKLTEADKSDLRTLYKRAWSKEIEDINGTPIRFVKPFHTGL